VVSQGLPQCSVVFDCGCACGSSLTGFKKLGKNKEGKAVLGKIAGTAERLKSVPEPVKSPFGKPPKVTSKDTTPPPKSTFQTIKVGESNTPKGQTPLPIKQTEKVKISFPSQAEMESNPLSEDIFNAKNQVIQSLEDATAGQRLVTGKGTIAQRSTFPDWIPDDLRKSTLIKEVLKHISNDTYPTSSPVKRLYEATKEQLDDAGKAAANYKDPSGNLNMFAGAPIAAIPDEDAKRIEKKIGFDPRILAASGILSSKASRKETLAYIARLEKEMYKDTGNSIFNRENLYQIQELIKRAKKRLDK